MLLSFYTMWESVLTYDLELESFFEIRLIVFFSVIYALFFAVNGLI